MALTNKQQELVTLLKATLPTAPAEVAQQNVEWYKEWVYNETVSIGDRRWTNVNGEKILYEVYAAAGDNLYSPDKVPAIWKRVFLEAYPEWIQPTGAHDAYAKGFNVTHNGKKWTSEIDSNVYEPGVYGWSEIPENQ